MLLIPDVVEGRRIVLEKNPVFENRVSQKLAPLSDKTAIIDVRNYSPDRIELDVNNPGSGKLLFIGNTFSPSWHASVNGSPRELLRANHAFQAVEIPSGKSTVILEYKNKLLQTLWVFGWFLLAISCVVIFVLSMKEKQINKIL